MLLGQMRRSAWVSSRFLGPPARVMASSAFPPDSDIQTVPVDQQWQQ
jgi:hypothetical protein